MAIKKFADEVMADGPIGYWRLGEPFGSLTVVDETGKQRPGRCEGLVTLGHPDFLGGDTAALFDGATARIVVPNSETLNPTRITMEAKIRWDGPNGEQQRILEKESYGGTTQYGLSVQPDGHVFVELRVINEVGTIKTVNATSAGVVTLGAETHVAATYDGLVICIYRNGMLDNAIEVNTSEFNIDVKWPHEPPDDPEVALAIGARIGFFRPSDPPLDPHNFRGLIDEVALYPKALSEERINAHYQAQFAEQMKFQYAAKVICGKSTGKIVASGVYFTAVNVHNPTYTTIDLRVKIAVALPGLQPGPVSKFYNAKLGPDEALEIDCPDISNPEIFEFDEPRKAGFLKGFVVIESDVELDVVAVYTAAGKEKQVETLHTERVPARQRKVGLRELCVDFESPLTVGTQYGAPAGNHSGDVIFTTNGIPVSVYDFNFIGGGGTFNVATIGLAPIPFGMSQSMNTNNINLEFDFSKLGFIPTEVRFDFLDQGGYENISVNGSPIFIGDLASVSNPIGGVTISISTAPVTGGKKGIVTLTGPVQKLRIGGQEFWIDNVCAKE